MNIIITFWIGYSVPRRSIYIYFFYMIINDVCFCTINQHAELIDLHCDNWMKLQSPDRYVAPLMGQSWRGVLDTTLCDTVCQWFAAGQWFSPLIHVSSTSKTDRHDITHWQTKSFFFYQRVHFIHFLSLPL
jgi:hypothetical protein